MTKGTITAEITEFDKKYYESLDAIIDDRGLLAVAKMLRHNSHLWAVYHVPTGAIVIGRYRRRQDAVGACYRLAQHDWNFRSMKSRKIRKLAPRVRAEKERYGHSD